MTNGPTARTTADSEPIGFGLTPISAFLGVLWLLVIVSGSAVLWTHQAAPGVSANPPETWPQASPLLRAPALPTLVVFAHPRCPCTRAVLTELARLMSLLHDRITAHVLLLHPDDTPEGWERTDLWRAAAAIPGVIVGSDAAGAEAARFDVATSGDTVLYDAAGRLLFHGGITVGRGHEGDSLGRAAILALVMHEETSQRQTPVFGCHLQPAVRG